MLRPRQSKNLEQALAPSREPHGKCASCGSGLHQRVRPSTPTVLELDRHLAWVSGCPVHLRPMEQRLLSILEDRVNQIVPTRELITMLYGSINFDDGSVRLRRLVADIRSRLDPSFARRLRTVRGIGIVLHDEVDFASSDAEASPFI